MFSATDTQSALSGAAESLSASTASRFSSLDVYLWVETTDNLLAVKFLSNEETNESICDEYRQRNMPMYRSSTEGLDTDSHIYRQTTYFT